MTNHDPLLKLLRNNYCAIIAGLLVSGLPRPAHAGVPAQEQASFKALGWEKQSYMIPMRDGARLYTEVLRPLDATEPLPFLLRRTPYNAAMTPAILRAH